MDNQPNADNDITLRYFTADFGRVPNTNRKVRLLKQPFTIQNDLNDLSLQFDNHTGKNITEEETPPTVASGLHDVKQSQLFS